MFMNKLANFLLMQHPKQPKQIQMISVGGTRLRVAIRPGRAKTVPLLLINGIGANLEMFDPLIDELHPNLEVICFDIPGVGNSPRTLLPQTLMSLASLTSKLLTQLGYKEVDVLGISWGGALAQQFAHQHPEQCRRLILVATSPGVFMIPAHISVLLKMISPARYMRPDYMMAVAPSIYGGRLRSNPELIHKILHKVRAPTGLGYYWQLMSTFGWTSIHWLVTLRQPTLIIAGDDDPLIPLANARFMARLIPQATLRVIRNGGHLYLLTDAQEAAAIIEDFLGVIT
jgi:poly(3-hydroxyoctanoate) depolymerase